MSTEYEYNPEGVFFRLKLASYLNMSYLSKKCIIDANIEKKNKRRKLLSRYMW